MLWVISCILIFAWVTPTSAQSFSRQKYEKAMQKLKEREHDRKQHPQTRPTSRRVYQTPPKEHLQPKPIKKLVLDAGAPQLIKDWFAKLPEYKEQEINKLYYAIDQMKARAQAEADRERGLLKEVQRRSVGTTQVRNALGGYSTVDDPHEIAQKRKEERQHRDQMYKFLRLIRVTDKSLEYLKKNQSTYLPTLKKWIEDHLPTYNSVYKLEKAIFETKNDPTYVYIPTIEKLDVGEVGYLQGSMRVAQVINRNNAMVMYGGTRIWLSGIDFSMTTDDRYITYSKPIIFIGTKTYKNVAGSTTTCLQAAPFPIFDYLKVVTINDGTSI